jgi:hypothetical protein
MSEHRAQQTRAQMIAGGQLPTVTPDPSNPLEALKGIHGHAGFMATGLWWLRQYIAERETNPVYKPHLINGATGVYYATDHPVGKPAQSLTVYNPAAITAYVGVGGTDATSAAGAIPVAQFLTLPLKINVIKVGFNPADLGAGSATLYVFRWPTLQPFAAE